jgi:hypothetical protein
VHISGWEINNGAVNLVRMQSFELDEHGQLPQITEEQCMEVFTQWANSYPTARFMVIAMAPDCSDAEELGWGLALPTHAFVYLPGVGVNGRFSSADRLLKVLRSKLDARLIWVDPEPEQVST